MALLSPVALEAQSFRPDPGTLLVATRRLQDPTFQRSVVLLLESSEEGVIGVIVNQPTGIEARLALPDLVQLEAREDQVFSGGPVDPQQPVILVRSDEETEPGRHVVEDVFQLRSLEALQAELDREIPSGSLRIYGGYAGWHAGQLEAEIDRGDWRWIGATAERIFVADTTGLWQELFDIVMLPTA